MGRGRASHERMRSAGDVNGGAEGGARRRREELEEEEEEGEEDKEEEEEEEDEVTAQVPACFCSSCAMRATMRWGTVVFASISSRRLHAEYTASQAACITTATSAAWVALYALISASTLAW